MSKAKYMIAIVISIALLPLFMMLSNPDNLPLALLMLPVLLVFVSWYLTTYIILMLLKHPEGRRKRKFMALASASLPTILLVLQSLQQLLPRDILIVTGLWLLLMWYLRRIDFA